MPKRKDLLVIAAVIAVAAVMLAVSKFMPRTRLEDKVAQETLAPDAVTYLDETAEPQETPDVTPAPAQTEAPEPSEAPETTEMPETTAAPEATQAPAASENKTEAAAGPMPRAQTAEVKGYVVLTVGGRQYGDPIPMDRDKIITIQQEDGKVNKIHITPEKVYMETSTCENQDCVGQGEISLDNYQTRILSTFVICLPNEVTIEMVPVE